jgi:hypothetical protein
MSLARFQGQQRRRPRFDAPVGVGNNNLKNCNRLAHPLSGSQEPRPASRRRLSLHVQLLLQLALGSQPIVTFISRKS